MTLALTNKIRVFINDEQVGYIVGINFCDPCNSLIKCKLTQNKPANEKGEIEQTILDATLHYVDTDNEGYIDFRFSN